MKRYLFALLCLTKVSFAQEQPKFQDSPLPEFQFYQGERLVRPANGTIRLRRSPFLIHFNAKYGRPSILVSSDPQTLSKIQQVKSPIVSWTGTGLAVAPFSLFVDDRPLKIFPDGWSPAFSDTYGKMFTEKNVELYQALKLGFPVEPTLLASGRNYSNFQLLSDGSSNYLISSLNDQGIEKTFYRKLYVVLFSESRDDRNPRDFQFVFLRYAPLTIEFY